MMCISNRFVPIFLTLIRTRIYIYKIKSLKNEDVKIKFTELYNALYFIYMNKCTLCLVKV